MNGLIFKKVTVAYRNHEVLHDASFSFSPGEVVGIIGPNGSGKTTLGKSIASLIRLKSGEISWKNNPIFNQKPEIIAKKIGYLFQNPNTALFARNVSDEFNIGFHLTAVEVDDLIKQFHLSRYRSTHPRHLSRGEKQRLALALVVARRVEVLILDEPFSGVDPAHKQILMNNLLTEITPEKLLILITHDLTTIFNYATHIIGLEKGRIVFEGKPNELLDGNYLESVGFQLPVAYYLLRRLRKEKLVPHTIITLNQLNEFFNRQK